MPLARRNVQPRERCSSTPERLLAFAHGLGAGDPDIAQNTIVQPGKRLALARTLDPERDARSEGSHPGDAPARPSAARIGGLPWQVPERTDFAVREKACSAHRG